MQSKISFKGYKYTNLVTIQQLIKLQVIHREMQILNPKLYFRVFNVSMLIYHKIALA